MVVAAGPLGRSLEADIAVRSTTAFFTYSKSRGLYAGVSLVGSALIERKSANAKFVFVFLFFFFFPSYTQAVRSPSESSRPFDGQSMLFGCFVT
jgi:hypothetical protein